MSDFLSALPNIQPKQPGEFSVLDLARATSTTRDVMRRVLDAMIAEGKATRRKVGREMVYKVKTK